MRSAVPDEALPHRLHISHREARAPDDVSWEERQRDNEDLLVLYGLCKNYEALVVRPLSAAAVPDRSANMPMLCTGSASGNGRRDVQWRRHQPSTRAVYVACARMDSARPGLYVLTRRARAFVVSSRLQPSSSMSSTVFIQCRIHLGAGLYCVCSSCAHAALIVRV